MKQFLNEYFSFNKRERNGILVLLVILSGVLIWTSLMKAPEALPDQLTTVYWPAVKSSGAGSDIAKPKKYAAEVENKIQKPVYFYFDPNTVGLQDWQKLGLSAHQAKVITNYVNKGGRFKRAEDLKKIYGLSAEQVEALQPWIRIAADTASLKKNLYQERAAQTKNQSLKLEGGIKLELNSADSMSLLRLPCIGPAFAKRILAYRKRLGGFVDANQLREVYGFDEERLACLYDRVEVDVSRIERIPINRISEEDLRKHPYFRWSLARSTCAFRKQHGKFRQTEDLLRLELMDSVLYRKIAPYISCDDVKPN